MSKRKNHNIDRRRLRAEEKGSEVTHDVMLGRACRRNYGEGRAKKSKKGFER
jgi:hypothetical protein